MAARTNGNNKMFLSINMAAKTDGSNKMFLSLCMAARTYRDLNCISVIACQLSISSVSNNKMYVSEHTHGCKD